jgi:hypothetical protein
MGADPEKPAAALFSNRQRDAEHARGPALGFINRLPMTHVLGSIISAPSDVSAKRSKATLARLLGIYRIDCSRPSSWLNRNILGSGESSRRKAIRSLNHIALAVPPL